jgi:hypothetical protein
LTLALLHYSSLFLLELNVVVRFLDPVDGEQVVLFFLGEHICHLVGVFELNFFVVKAVKGNSCVLAPVLEIQNVDKITPHQLFKNQPPISGF